MQKAGGIVGIIAGIFGVFAAIVTLTVGGLAGAFKADNASTVIGLGWGGILFSFLCIVFGATAISAASRLSAVLLALSAVAGIILGGTLVAVFMALAFVGGLIALVQTGRPVISEAASPPLLEREQGATTGGRWVWAAAASAVAAFVVVFLALGSQETAKQSPQASATVSSPPASQPPPRLAAAQTPSPAPVPQTKVEIKLNSYNCSRAHGFMTVEGEVTNISNSPIKGLMVVASHYSNDGTFVRSDTGMIEYNPLMPGQSSPFKAMSTDNPMTRKCKVEFKRIFGGKVEFLQ